MKIKIVRNGGHDRTPQGLLILKYFSRADKNSASLFIANTVIEFPSLIFILSFVMVILPVFVAMEHTLFCVKCDRGEV